MVQELVHQNIVKNLDGVYDWFASYRSRLILPFYSSVDVRDSHLKVASVDANLYPAGFNNICPADREQIPEIMRDYIFSCYGPDIKNIALITEEHTNNPPYWDNVVTISHCLHLAGFQVRVCIPREFTGTAFLNSASGKKVEVFPSKPVDGELRVGENWKVELIISNNDFSQSYEDWGEGLRTAMNPAREMGWYQRKKSTHFKYYNQVAKEFAKIIGVDPWIFTVRTETYSASDILSDEGMRGLSQKVDSMIEVIRQDYEAQGIKEAPVVFIKNNSGTYGLGVVSVSSGKDVEAWNAKTRKQMKVSKGKRSIEEVIIQEGVRSAIRTNVGTAEPTIYMVGCDLVGAFLRAHAERSDEESLNSPGAVYQKLCVSDLKVNIQGKPMENVYGWVARLSSLAIGLEIEEMGVEFRGYNLKTKCPTA